ncbi:Alkaline phosphatase [Candidatus Rhodobacter oscarellae]|uniref:Alkaline phosphatase n=1 Tax=Candidatus Rhodobacter oscarellae TaxID=1675527 RepID=A0A0J9EBZ1_9RHOB|nr:M10 family metallopeptidase [Candidatus Rhodobacter lobularis]KMW59204.1 Alkaline phosphatase [Candidatus Rhodobacter lobularis]
MCTICQAFHPFEDECSYSALAEDRPTGILADFLENTDAPGGISTPYSLSVGDTLFGTLSRFDVDWVAVDVVAGQTYAISLNSAASGGIGDAYLRLYDSGGNFIGYNDNGGTGDNAFVNYTATYTGTIYVSAEDFRFSAGDYELSVAAGTAYAQSSLDQIASQLTNTYWGGTQRAFNASVSDTITVNITGLTAEGQQLARWALEAWTNVSGLQFQEVSSGAQITFDDNQSGAYANFSYSGGTIRSATINVSTAWLSSYGTTIDSYSFQTYMHEIGHALGLGHGGPYNGSAEYGNDNSYLNDSWQQTVMSYFSQSENYNVVGDFGYTVSLMAADIVAIQNLYGSNVTAHAGDTVYGANSTVGGYLGDYFQHFFGEVASDPAVYDGNYTAVTIYDTGGTDTLDFTPVTSDQLINLYAEAASNVGGRIGNLVIARDTTIENVNSGAGNDTLIGNEVGNVLVARGGNDAVYAGNGNDSVLGGNGDDLLNGDNENDTLNGGNGNDTVTGGRGDDSLLGGNNHDILFGWLGLDTLNGGAGSDTLIGEEDSDLLDGWSGNDFLYGGQGWDTLIGGGGNDSLSGDSEDDQLFGGNGQDTLAGGTGRDLLEGGDGADQLWGWIGDDTLSGGVGNDLLVGEDGNDYLVGWLDDDTLDGGAGDDTMNGEGGNDLFVFFDFHGNDTILGFEATNDAEDISLAGITGLTSFAQMQSSGAINQVGADVVIDTGTGTITLAGVSLGDLDQNDFVF